MKDNTYFKELLKADNGIAVLGLVGFKDEDKFYYTVYPVIGKRGKYHRVMILKPLTTRALPVDSEEEAVSCLFERASNPRFHADFNSDMNCYSITWNDKFIGFINDYGSDSNYCDAGLVEGTVMTSYLGEMVDFVAPSLNRILDNGCDKPVSILNGILRGKGKTTKEKVGCIII